jgi:hypothetical protein
VLLLPTRRRRSACQLIQARHCGHDDECDHRR